MWTQVSAQSLQILDICTPNGDVMHQVARAVGKRRMHLVQRVSKTSFEFACLLDQVVEPGQQCARIVWFWHYLRRGSSPLSPAPANTSMKAAMLRPGNGGLPKPKRPISATPTPSITAPVTWRQAAGTGAPSGRPRRSNTDRSSVQTRCRYATN